MFECAFFNLISLVTRAKNALTEQRLEEAILELSDDALNGLLELALVR